MIERIAVRGMGGITSAELDLSGDLIVITGESGSGKSSLVRAFEFITGRRAQTSSINAASDEVSVEALWSDGGEEVVTKRTLSRSGKSRAFVNGSSVTASMLADQASGLIGIQSQFSQLDLLDPARQLYLVDSAGGAELAEVRGRLGEVFPAMIEMEREIASLKKRKAEIEDELEGAVERVRRIRALKLTDESEAEWSEELASVERAAANAARYAHITERIGGGDGGDDIFEQVASIVRDIYSAAPDDLRERWNALGESALTDLGELFRSAKQELSLSSADELEARRDEAEAKIGALRQLKREVGALDARDLVKYAERVGSEMEWLRESGREIAERSARAAEMKAEAASLARSLRAMRERAAAALGERVSSHLKDLAMEGARFSVDLIKHDRIRANGAETAVFTLAVGDLPPNAVSRAASGGELSRILIAIQTSIDSSSLPGSIVFDEVEAGLGGRAALLAGQKLRELSERCRVILITHEATIAAMASQHFLVSRSGDETSVAEITGEAREVEIARMLAGSDSPEALEHARSLLKSARPDRADRIASL